MTPNYPNHPLFRITPLLNDGQSTVRHDEYTSRLIGRIRAGRYMPELWDCNSFYLNYSERIGTAADRQTTAIKSRYKLTAEQLAEYRNGPEAQERRAKALADKARREAEEAEFWRVRREHAERQTRLAAEKQRLEAERAAEWDRIGAETQQWRMERTWIMGGPWECTGCRTPSQISVEPAGRYAISCRDCGRRTVTDHGTLVSVLRAHKAQPTPDIVGSPLCDVSRETGP